MLHLLEFEMKFNLIINWKSVRSGGCIDAGRLAFNLTGTGKDAPLWRS
jgi:hypothetical protein